VRRSLVTPATIDRITGDGRGAVLARALLALVGVMDLRDVSALVRLILAVARRY
jgi:hypothetical protein